MQVFDTYAVKLHNLYAGGLIIISLVILQDFLSANPLDRPAFLAVLAFSIALPMLSGTLVLNVVEERFKYGPAKSPIAQIVRYVFLASILLDLAGIAAAFWHASWITGLVFIVSQLAALTIYGIYILKLEDKVSTAPTKGV